MEPKFIHQVKDFEASELTCVWCKKKGAVVSALCLDPYGETDYCVCLKCRKTFSVCYLLRAGKEEARLVKDLARARELGAENLIRKRAKV